MLEQEKFNQIRQQLIDKKNQKISGSMSGNQDKQGFDFSSLFTPGFMGAIPVTTPQNVIKSGGNFISGMGEVITHPINTLKNIGNLVAGGAETLANKVGINTQDTEEKQTFDKFLSYMKDRYGGVSNIQKTIYDDPVGFAMDMSILSGGAVSLTKVMGLEKVTDVLKAVSEGTDPLRLTLKAGGGAAKGVGKAGENILGLTTKKGASVIDQAFQAGKEGGEAQEAFKSGMRGGSTEAGVVERSRDALNRIIQDRSKTYKSEISKIKAANPKALDISPILDKEQQLLKDFNIKVKEDGSLDLSRSPLIGDKTKIQAIHDLLNDYGTQAGDRTVIGIDILKRNVKNFRSSDATLNSFVDKLSGSVGDLLKKDVKGYSELMKNWGDKTALIQDIQKDLSLGDKASIDRAFKNLTNAVKKDNELKVGLMKNLEDAGAKNLIKEIAGVNLKDVLPDDIFRIAIDISTIFAATTGYVNPAVMVDVLSTSPRIVGETMNALGVGAKYASQATEIMNKFKLLGGMKAATKAGYRINQSQE